MSLKITFPCSPTRFDRSEPDQALPAPDIEERLAFFESGIVEDTISDRMQIVEVSTLIFGETVVPPIGDPLRPLVALRFVHDGKGYSVETGPRA